MQENRENIRLNSLDILQDLQVRRDRVRGIEVVLTTPSAQAMESRWGHLFLRFISGWKPIFKRSGFGFLRRCE